MLSAICFLTLRMEILLGFETEWDKSSFRKAGRDPKGARGRIKESQKSKHDPTNLLYQRSDKDWTCWHWPLVTEHRLASTGCLQWTYLGGKASLKTSAIHSKQSPFPDGAWCTHALSHEGEQGGWQTFPQQMMITWKPPGQDSFHLQS